MLIVKILIMGLVLAASAVIVLRTPVNGWGSLLWLVGQFGMGFIRFPFEQENRANVVVESRKTVLEKLLLACVFLGTFLLPVVQLTTGLFGFANVALPPWTVVAGALVLALGLWLFWRSHVDLGRNWSVTLEVREGHTLIEAGVYRRVRHPMYSALFLIFIAQALLISNLVAGPSGVVSMAIIYLFRVRQEEAMMRDRFGERYEQYCSRTGRLIPGGRRRERWGQSAGVRVKGQSHQARKPTEAHRSDSDP
ncbi:MAG: protein-S-isoprenylcysteine O-methyltransferase, partial [Pseudomonadota bacterium]